MIIKTMTFGNVARIWPRGGWGFDLREPKTAPPKTKQKSDLAFIRETQIQQKNSLQGIRNTAAAGTLREL